MSWGSADDLHRTAKILIDRDEAKDPGDAERFLSQLVLQIAVGPDLDQDHPAQAALATAVNVGRRAFHGGVRVRLDTDTPLTTGWIAGHAASAVVVGSGASSSTSSATTSRRWLSAVRANRSVGPSSTAPGLAGRVGSWSHRTGA